MKVNKKKVKAPKVYDQIELEVRDIVFDVTTYEGNFEMSARLREDLNADDIDLIEITMCLEDKFQIAIDEEEIDSLFTINDLLNCVRSKAQLVTS